MEGCVCVWGGGEYERVGTPSGRYCSVMVCIVGIVWVSGAGGVVAPVSARCATRVFVDLSIFLNACFANARKDSTYTHTHTHTGSR